MSDKEVKLTERIAGHTDNVVVSKPTIEGYLAFYRTDDTAPWYVAFPTLAVGENHSYCPSPLFQDKTKAISRAQELLAEGGKIMIFKVAE